jgi:SET domain-containing protein
MMTCYLERTWVSRKLRPGKSPIHGEGVFATAPIGAGELVMEFGGELVAADRLEDYREPSAWAVKGGLYLALRNTDTEDSLDEYLNHSCEANTWLTGETTLVARRDIAAGEEITLDQGTWNFDEADYADAGRACTCNAVSCRGVLTHDDWRRTDVQARYLGHFHPLVQALIDAG